MAYHHAKQRELEREARRMRVAALLLGGVTDQRTIAKELGVGQATVCRDIAVIEQRWRDVAIQDLTAAKGKDLQRTERLIQAFWPEAIRGDRSAADRVLSLMQHRSRLLGLEAPQKREDTVRVTVEQIADRLAAQSGFRAEEIIAEAEAIIAAAQENR